MDSTKGYIHVYTGNGKGKTTAAFGLAVRVLCAGKSVYIGQFVKSMRYNETKIGQLFDQVKIEQLGRGCFIGKDPEAIDIRMARDGLTRCAALLESGETDTEVVQETLDEAVCGINNLQEEFDENDSEIETVARECIAATVAYILEWFGIPIDTEEAIRERDW